LSTFTIEICTGEKSWAGKQHPQRLKKLSIKMCEHVDEIVEQITEGEFWISIGLAAMRTVDIRNLMTAVEAMFIFS
jgi:hypothetical protein